MYQSSSSIIIKFPIRIKIDVYRFKRFLAHEKSDKDAATKTGIGSEGKNSQHNCKICQIQKWKMLMLETLQKLAFSPHFDQRLIQDLTLVVKKMPQERFVEAIINLQPYKPNFKTCYSLTTNRQIPKVKVLDLSPNKDLQDEATTTTGSIIRKVSSQGICAAMRMKRKQELIAMFIEDDLLSSEISSQNHPFAKVIEGLSFILENKYKFIIDKQVQLEQKMTLEEFVNKMSKDYELIQQFFKISSAPIIDIFNTNDQRQRQKFAQEVHNFMVNYLRNNQKICLSLRKILRYFIKDSKELAAFNKHCPLQAEVEKFGLPPKFQIEGCYVYTTSQIIAFSQLFTGKQCLTQLAVIRDSIYRDIDQFYKGQNKNLEVSSEVQLQILKFALVKVQIFVPEILAQLKLLQILYGSEEISYHFDEASYIHSQMTISFEAIQHNL